MSITDKSKVSTVDIEQNIGQSLKVGTPTSVTVLAVDQAFNVVKAKGTTVPTDADTGFAKGCLFIKTNGTTGTTLYLNEGDETSADFNPIETPESAISGVTAGTGISGGGTSGTVTVTLAENYLRVATVTLTAAEVKALATTPIELVAAPGANKYIEFVGATLRLVAGSEAFTETDDNLGIKFENASGVQVSDTIECTGFIDQTVDTVTSAVPVKDAIVAESAAVNKALVLDNLADNFAGNASDDGALTVITAYRVHTFA